MASESETKQGGFANWLRRTIPKMPSPLATFFIRQLEKRWSSSDAWCHCSCRDKRDRRLLKRAGSPRTVLQGPFKDMKYVRRSGGSVLVAKLLGTYEMELYSAVEKLIAHGADLIADVGAAEGYYAVGLAWRCKEVRVIGYEFWEPSRLLSQHMALLNGVAERFEAKGGCTPELLEKDIASARRPLVISDCEGYEDTLLNPAIVPSLKRAAILVEMHEFEKPGVSQRIKDRFADTHTLEIIETRPRTLADLPPGLQMPRSEAEVAMGEGRSYTQQWFLLFPK